MDFELEPVTAAGCRLVKLAEDHATDFATRAAEHDREGTFPAENFAAMQRSGVAAACVPVELGGMGLESIHDLTVAISRLARGDGSTAIGAAMHIAPQWGMTRVWRETVHAGDAAAGLEAFLAQVGSHQILCAIALTEAGTTLLHPLTEAAPVDGGYVLAGRKSFATNSPLADLFMMSARTPLDDGTYGLVMAFVSRHSDGLVIHDTWDAMGMRASCSNDIVLENCFVPTALTMPLGPWGRWDVPLLSLSVPGSFPLLGAFLGIAEAARDAAVGLVTTRRKAPGGRVLAERAAVQRVVAEIEVHLAVARATLARTATAIDAYFASRTSADLQSVELHGLLKEYQCTNLVVKQAAIAAVDLALTASGGGGYMASNPISRHYRDVRAGPFMQPYSPLEAYEYIGRVTLGVGPESDA